ncbi:MAG: hypothetical protein ACLR6B_17615 [Blautia sp.]
MAGFCLAFHEYHLNAGKSDSTSKASLPEDSSFARKLLCYAQAAAAGSLIKPGTAVCERADFEQYLPSIQVEKAGEFFDVRREDGSLTGEVNSEVWYIGTETGMGRSICGWWIAHRMENTVF